MIPKMWLDVVGSELRLQGRKPRSTWEEEVTTGSGESAGAGSGWSRNDVRLGK